jgi:hypothetical protein
MSWGSLRGRGEGPALLLALLLTVPAPAACSRDINLLPPRADGGGGGGGGGDTSTNPACSGVGDPIRLPTAAAATCAAALATRGHRFTLCSCQDMNAPARVRTDSYDSRAAATAFEETGAAIGVGGNLTASAEVRAGGALYVAGAGGVDVSNQLRTAASLRAGGPVTIRDDNADVATDAYVSGNVTATGGGRFRVTGTLHVPAGVALTGVEAGSTVNEAVAVPPPCDCSAGFVDTAAAIGATAAANANADIGLQPTALADVATPASIQLPCGAFYLTEIDAQAALTLVVRGRALLAIGGDLTARAGLTVQLDPDAELDLLVGGQLIVTGGGSFGAPAAAARFRVWVASTTTVLFDGAPAVSAVVHAAGAQVTAPGGLPLSGSLLARTVAIGADSTLHFDRAILEAGTICGEPAAVPVP